MRYSVLLSNSLLRLGSGGCWYGGGWEFGSEFFRFFKQKGKKNLIVVGSRRSWDVGFSSGVMLRVFRNVDPSFPPSSSNECM